MLRSPSSTSKTPWPSATRRRLVPPAKRSSPSPTRRAPSASARTVSRRSTASKTSSPSPTTPPAPTSSWSPRWNPPLVSTALDANGYTPDIWALIESPRAFDNLPAITRAPRLGGVIFGSADYAATVRCGLDWDALHYARSALINAATAANLPAIDAPTWNLNDPGTLRQEAERAKNLGFHGKGCVHPRHVEVINEVFTPTAEEIAQARAVVAAADASSGTVTTVDGQMRGTPFFNAARALIAEADADRTP